MKPKCNICGRNLSVHSISSNLFGETTFTKHGALCGPCFFDMQKETIVGGSYDVLNHGELLNKKIKERIDNAINYET